MDDETLAKTIDALMKTMTFEEKINLVSMNTDPENRSGVGYITGVPRLGVPESRMHDGPSGISTGTQNADSYVETTNMPLQLTTSMTWSTDLVYAYGGSARKRTCVDRLRMAAGDADGSGEDAALGKGERLLRRGLLPDFQADGRTDTGTAGKRRHRDGKSTSALTARTEIRPSGWR